MVNCHYYKKLFLNYTNSYDNIKKNSIDNYAIDKGWQSLQKTDNWYIFDPLAGYQDSSYSDIEKKFTNYFNQKYILCNLKGELGNQLFQIANAYYLSKKYGKKLIVSNDNPELNKLYHEIEKNLLQNNFETENVSEKEFKYVCDKMYVSFKNAIVLKQMKRMKNINDIQRIYKIYNTFQILLFSKILNEK